MTGFASIRERIRSREPELTVFAIGLNLLGFVAMLLVDEFVLSSSEARTAGDPSLAAMIYCGALVPGHVAAGEIWRLMTCVFLHGGLMHLAFNSFATYNLLPLVQSRLGFARSLTLYVLGGICASATSFGWSMLSPHDNPILDEHIHLLPPGVGASGAVFALLGFLIGLVWRSRDPMGASLRRQLVFWLVINVAYGLTSSNIDNAAHFGGLAFGVVFGRLDATGAPRLIAAFFRSRRTALAAALLAISAIGAQATWSLGAPGAEFRRLETAYEPWRAGEAYVRVVQGIAPPQARRTVAETGEMLQRLDRQADSPELEAVRRYFEVARRTAEGETVTREEREKALTDWNGLLPRMKRRLGPLCLRYR